MLLNCGVGEDSWESPGLHSVHPKGNQSWILIGRTDAEATTPILWPSDAKNSLEKTLITWKDWRQEEKGMTEDNMAGWYHPLDGHEFEQAPGAGDGKGSQECCSPWGHKELDTTERRNWLKEHCLSYQRAFMYKPLEWSLHLLRKKGNHHFFPTSHIKKTGIRQVKMVLPLSEKRRMWLESTSSLLPCSLLTELVYITELHTDIVLPKPQDWICASQPLPVMFPLPRTLV